jgi:cysteinyl-tRNA synthetase
MSLDLLGEGFDLHVGGQDLKFPHHENERAQAVAMGRAFANHWGHSGWVMVGSEKMSKSLKNFTSLTDLLSTSDARAYRLLCIQSHYRAPLEVTSETISAAEVALQRLDNMARRFRLPPLGEDPIVLDDFELDATLRRSVVDALDDDLDTPKAFALLATAVSAANAAADEGDEARGTELARSVAVLLGALGISVRSGLSDIAPEATALAELRDAARLAKNWAEADRLRGALEALGYTVEDRAGETFLSR